MVRYDVVLAICFVTGASTQKPAWMENLFNLQNEHRADHGVQPLVMSEKLEEDAQGWANHLAEQCSKLDHSEPETRMMNGVVEGENLFRARRNRPPKDMILYAQKKAHGADVSWYGESKNYPWPEFSDTSPGLNGEQITHFSQMVWKDTKQVGYGLGTRPGCDWFYVVGRFWPTGNMMGSFSTNVFPKDA